MSLPAGTQLGPYRITSSLGAGGMGEVYRATDTTLKRDVAIKVLPPALAADPERTARFAREAQVLASLNHTNIAQLYGLETSTGMPALVMELVDGTDLSALIARGPLPLTDALEIARQIIDAMETAHELGVIHRDLKPQNIKVRADGVVKVLDFGLAKALDPATGASTDDVTNSPTMTVRATMLGMIIGTAAYMAPEQARGRAVDRRADIWAFGAVLYEMLAGRRAFEGDDVSVTLANVIKDDVNWQALPPDTPDGIVTLLRRCLEKDPKKRLAWIGEARWAIDHFESAGSTRTTVPRDRRWMPTVAAVVLLLGVAGWAWYRWPRESTRAITQFTIPVPEGNFFATGAGRPGTVPVISPDGRAVVFTATAPSGQRMLWIRRLDTLTATILPGTEGAGWPFWSPDSRHVAYSAKARLMKISADGGPSTAICALGTGISARGGTWNARNEIVINNGPSVPLFRVNADGGTATPIGALREGETARQFPSFLPDGFHYLYYSTGTADITGLWVGDLDGRESKRLTNAETAGVYDATAGLLLFGRQSALVAAPFDPKALTFRGDPAIIADRLETSVVPGVVAFSISNAGTLAYGIGTSADTVQQLAWADRRGNVLREIGPTGTYLGLDLSPDDRRLAVHRHEGDGGDLWVMDLDSNTASRLTFTPGEHNASPAWSPDGRRIAFASTRAGRVGLYVKNGDNTGAETLVFDEPQISTTSGPQPASWTADNRVLFSMQMAAQTGPDLWLTLATGGAKPAPLLHESYSESRGAFSPDGKWLAYTASETGTNDIYVQPANGVGGKWAITTDGAAMPRWRRDSRELFYVSVGRIFAVTVNVEGNTPRFGRPEALFDARSATVFTHDPYFAYDVSADGQHFVIARPIGSGNELPQSPIVIIQHWATFPGRN